MRLLALIAASLSAEELTPLDRTQIELADEKIRRTESEYRNATIMKQIVVANICARVDAPIANCAIDIKAGTVTKKPAETPKKENTK